jgi:hypothetical protein
MDKKAIRKALDHFENDEFVDAKDIIAKEIQGKRDVFLKDKLGLSQDINPAPAADAQDQDADAGDDAGNEGDE